MNKENECVLCGFVFRSGKELEAWQVELSDEDERKIWNILLKYGNEGCSVKDASKDDAKTEGTNSFMPNRSLTSGV